jgi:predicted O-methyltransferase YrrM
MELEQVLTELESFGTENDRVKTDYAQRMMNIPRATGQFLQVLVMNARAKRVLEIGTSNGYSTLWLARGARAVGGEVTTVDLSPYKIGLARANFEKAGMNDVIIQVQAKGGDFLKRTADECYDFMFLDSERTEYQAWWPHIKRVLKPGGLWVADNAISHAHELKTFFAMVEADPEFTTSLVPIGKGEYLAVKKGIGE